MADKIFFGHTYKFGIGIWFSAVQWRRFPHRASVVRDQNQWPNKPETLLIDFNAQKSFDVPIEIKENTRIKEKILKPVLNGIRYFKPVFKKHIIFMAHQLRSWIVIMNWIEIQMLKSYLFKFSEYNPIISVALKQFVYRYTWTIESEKENDKFDILKSN